MSVFENQFTLNESIIFSENVEKSTFFTQISKAMMQEVTELSDNFCGELSVRETGVGIRNVFCETKNMKHSDKCALRIPSYRNSENVRKLKEERPDEQSENQN